MDLKFVRRSQQAVAFPDHMAALTALLTLRREWELAAEGESLTQVNTSVGLLLDVTTKLGFTREDQKLVLGGNSTRKPSWRLRVVAEENGQNGRPGLTPFS